MRASLALPFLSVAAAFAPTIVTTRTTTSLAAKDPLPFFAKEEPAEAKKTPYKLVDPAEPQPKFRKFKNPADSIEPKFTPAPTGQEQIVGGIGAVVSSSNLKIAILGDEHDCH